MGIKKKKKKLKTVASFLTLPAQITINYLPVLTSEPIIFEMYRFIQNVHHYTDAKIVTI